MTNKKLFEILVIVDGVNIHNWDIVRKVVDNIQYGTAKVLTKEWRDTFKNKNQEYYPLDLSIISTWSTYDITCINLKFTYKSKKLILDAKIYEGDNYYGHRKDLRFNATIEMPSSFLKIIEPHINRKLDSYLEDKYEEFLIEQKKHWILLQKLRILKNK